MYHEVIYGTIVVICTYKLNYSVERFMSDAIETIRKKNPMGLMFPEIKILHFRSKLEQLNMTLIYMPFLKNFASTLTLHLHSKFNSLVERILIN